jgi:hypothetical protein
MKTSLRVKDLAGHEEGEPNLMYNENENEKNKKWQGPLPKWQHVRNTKRNKRGLGRLKKRNEQK